MKPGSVWHWSGWRPLGLVALVWMVYGGSLSNGFHYDDTHSIVRNPYIRTLRNLPRFFTDPATFSAEPRMAMYRPLLVTSYALNYAVQGLDSRGFHVVNLLVHSLVVLFVYGLLRQQVSRGLAAWGAAIFAVHPAHTQALEYISSRSELMAGLAVVAAVRGYASRGRLRFLAPVAYAAGLLCKSTAIATLPLLFLHAALHRNLLRTWRRQSPFWLITVGYLALIMENGFLGGALAQHVRSYPLQLANQIKASVIYLGLFVMPVHLSVEHAFVDRSGWWNAPVLAAAVLGLTLAAVILRNGGRQELWGLGWVAACSALTFLIPLNVQVSEQRMYLPSIGALLLVVVLLRHRPLSVPLRWAGWTLVSILAVTSWQRAAVWKDDLTLWSDAVAQAPGSFRAQSNFGLALYEAGKLDAAGKALRGAISINPRYARTWNNLGLVLEERGEVAAAASAYRRSTFLDPQLADAHANLGRLLLRAGRTTAALARLRRAVAANPYSVSAQVNLGLALRQAGAAAAARAALERAIQIQPASAAAWNDLGLLFLDQERWEQAREAFARAVNLDPRHGEARINLRALELRQQGVSRLEACVRLTREFPEEAGVWTALGAAAAAGGRWDQAAAAFERALGLDAGNYLTYLRLGAVQRHAGHAEQAIGVYQRALRVGLRSAPVYDALTAAYAAEGRLSAALGSCRQALAADPQDSTARRHLQLLLARVRETQREPTAP